MPEGDSYIHAAASVRPILEGQLVERVDGTAASVRGYAARIMGRRVSAVRTYGKHLFIDLDSGYSVHVHLGMNGRIRTTRRVPGSAGPAKLLLTTPRGAVRVTAAPEVSAERTAGLDARVLGPLGPDLIAEAFDWAEFDRRAAAADPAASAADFLLDQRIAAGVGNEYKSEVLFLQRRHPATPVAELDGAARTALAERARTLLRANLRPGPRVTTGERARPAWVYARSGRACLRCRDRITEAWLGAPEPRITYWCPTCQPGP